MTLLRVPALLLTQVCEVVEARPIACPLALAPIIGLRFGFLLDGRLGGERAAHFLVLGRVFVRLWLRVEVVVGDVHIVRIWDVEVNGKRFFMRPSERERPIRSYHHRRVRSHRGISPA
jgi:hypothetical protein